MMYGFGWAKNPMIKRIGDLHKDVPVTFMYGSESWVENLAGKIMKEKRPGSFVQSHIIQGAGHHVYADKPELFNRTVVETCAMADANSSKRHLSSTALEDVDVSSEENIQNNATPNT